MSTKTTFELLADLAAEIESMPPPPPTEYRLHPDDWEDLKRTVVETHEPINKICGLWIVVDPDAPRLPRTKD